MTRKNNMQVKKQKASILVVTLMVLGIILVTALSISLVSIKERKAAMSSSKSSLAYQTADTGIENVMDAILSNRSLGDKVNSLAGIDCGSGKVIGAGYVVELKKDDGTGAETTALCTDKLTDIIAIKSVGTASGQQRAIEAAVAADTSWAVYRMFPSTYPNPWGIYDNIQDYGSKSDGTYCNGGVCGANDLTPIKVCMDKGYANGMVLGNSGDHVNTQAWNGSSWELKNETMLYTVACWKTT